MISDGTIQEVKSRIDILDVISDFVDLKKSGSNYKALSPFTNEKTPSFYVSPAKNLFKCFSTGKGGDAITFLEEHEGFTYLEAIKYLAKKYGVTIEETESNDFRNENNEKESLYIVLKMAGEMFKDILFNHESGKTIGLAYFRERGLSDTTIKEFELGFSLDEWDHLLKTALEKGYKEEILEKAGLIIKKDDGKIYDRFRNRAMFPIHNVVGKIIGFGARQLVNDKKSPKYINSPESDVYKKSSELYGMHQARQSIRNEDMCYLVEGYMDVLSMYQAGVKNVVASSGTSLTEDQIKLISRYTKNITVLYDGDPAGLKAALRGIDMIIEQGLSVKVLLFPEGHDPDSYLKTFGAEPFLDLVKEQSKDFIQFKADLLIAEGKTDTESRIHALREIVDSISRIPDALARSVHIRETSEKFRMDEGVLYAEVNKRILESRKKQQASVQREELQSTSTTSFLDVPAPETPKQGIEDLIRSLERECLRLLVNYGNEPESDYGFYHSFFFEATEDIEFSDPIVKKMITAYRITVNEGIAPTMEHLASDQDESIRSMIAELYFQRYELSENWDLKYKITVLREYQVLDLIFPRNIMLLKFYHLQKVIQEEQQRLKESRNADETDQILGLLSEYKKLQKEYGDELGIVVHR